MLSVVDRQVPGRLYPLYPVSLPVFLCLSSSRTVSLTRGHNLFVRSGKSEAEVTTDRRLRSTYCTIEATTDRHEASRGLSATAGLLFH